MSPKIGIILGSASDAAMARKIGEVLKDLKVSFEVTVASAHRTPDDVANYSAKAADRGLKVIIAAAGLSAALPGVVAAHTTLPVIGLPVESGSLLGLDALFSVAMMPPGVPVASVGINGAHNAALLAARIVALDDPDLALGLQEYAAKAAEKVRRSRQDLADLPLAPKEATQR